MDLQIPYNPWYCVGDIISVEGKNFKITKKTRTAIAVERYYFWNKWWDMINGRDK